jgi:hypothetical protein
MSFTPLRIVILGLGIFFFGVVSLNSIITEPTIIYVGSVSLVIGFFIMIFGVYRDFRQSNYVSDKRLTE